MEVPRHVVGRFEDRADVGVEVGAPRGSEAVGIWEDDAGPQGLFGPLLVGEPRGRQEDEQALAEALDDALELQARLVVRHDLEQSSSARGAGCRRQGGVGECRTTVADAHSALEQMLQPGRSGIAGVDRVLESRSRWARQLMVPVASPLGARRSEIQTAGGHRRGTRPPPLPRDGRITKQRCRRGEHPVQKVFLPTRTLVSSEASTVLDSRRA